MSRRRQQNDSPDWWLVAVELEAADKLAEAEAVIRRALDPVGDPSSAQIGYLYELRCRRLIRQGKLEEARVAAGKGCHFMREYASGASSGGEGIALHRESQDYRKSLERLLRNAANRSRNQE